MTTSPLIDAAVAAPVAVGPRRGLASAPSGADAEALAGAAVYALTAEALLTPKPGLVDGRGPGVHPDMNLSMLMASARSLAPAFAEMARAGAVDDDPARLRVRLAEIGRRGEQAMYAATGGVNTHRGAIWALGLAVGAAAGGTVSGRMAPAAQILARVARIAACPDAARTPDDTAGARARRRYRTGGAIAEAKAGFPHAGAALDRLVATRALGVGEQDARLDALMAAMAGLSDTCLLSRGGRRGLRTARRGAASVLAAGGCSTPRGHRRLEALDRRLARDGVSPGGGADMLALALFLDAIGARAPHFTVIDHASKED